jgi:hypothetical protein
LRLSTLALDGSEASDGGRILRFADLAVLALALPVFLLAGLPLLGYAVAAAAWLAQHAIFTFAERRSTVALRSGDRTSAVGSIAVATFVRLWVVTGAILLVGLLAEREDGLAAAVLCAVLVTVHLGAVAVSRMVASGPEGSR